MSEGEFCPEAIFMSEGEFWVLEQMFADGSQQEFRSERGISVDDPILHTSSQKALKDEC